MSARIGLSDGRPTGCNGFHTSVDPRRAPPYPGFMQAADAAELTPDLDEGLFEMANLRPRTTGLPFVVFVSQRGGARHDVRIKVSRNPRARPEEMVSIPLRPEIIIPEGALSRAETASLRAWVDLNRDVLVDYWNGDIAYTEDLLDALKSV